MTTLAERIPPEFWVVIDKLDEWSVDQGFPVRLRPMLESIAIFDPDAVRAVLPAWGVDGADGLPDKMNDALEDRVSVVVGKIGERWQGDAWDAFSGSMDHAKHLLDVIGEPARMTGEALGEWLESLELSVREIVGMVLEYAGLVLAAVGVVTAAVAGTGIVLAIVGAILSGIGIVVSDQQRAAERIEAFNELTRRFRDQVAKVGPADRGGPYTTPPSADWDAKTSDPKT